MLRGGPTLAYVLGRDDRPQGMAFCVGPRFFLTCAHVVAEALPGHDRYGRDSPSPDRRVRLHFFETGSSLAVVTAKVAQWSRCVRPEDPAATAEERRCSDIAVLELGDEDLAALADTKLAMTPRSARLLGEDELSTERSFDVYGSPAGGVLGKAELGFEVGGRLIAVQTRGAAIGPGFSGGAATVPFGPSGPGVLGMLVRAHGEESQCQVIPSSTLRRVLSAVLDPPPAPRRPSPLRIRLERDELYILKDRHPALDIARMALEPRADGVARLPVLVAGVDPSEDCCGGFARRLAYEAARDAGLVAALQILGDDRYYLTPPTNRHGGLDALLRAHQIDVALALSLGRDCASPLERARAGHDAAWICDLDLTDRADASFGVGAATMWAAVCAGRSGASSWCVPASRGVPFFLLLTTTRRFDAEARCAFVDRLREEAAGTVEAHDLGDFGYVNTTHLRRWARDAAAHLEPRLARETARLERKAQKLIYGERTEMSMYSWYEGLEEHGRCVLGDCGR